MNKERARELINRMKELLKESDKHTYQTFNVIRTFKEEYAQALDIAIESLDNDYQTGTPKESGYYLVINGANKADIRKYDNGWYHDMYRRYTNKELEIIAWKKVEPYERKEQK